MGLRPDFARSVRNCLELLDGRNHLNVEYISFRENLDTGGPPGGVGRQHRSDWSNLSAS